MIPETDIAALKAQLPAYMAAVGVQLTKCGNRMKGLCPVHSDTDPSFALFGRGHERAGCYPCNFTGDVFAVSNWLGRSSTFPEAIRDVATAVGFPIAANLPTPKPSAAVRSIPMGATQPEPEEADTKADMKDRAEFEAAHAKARRELFEACQRKTITAVLIAKEFGIDLETLRQLTFTSDALGIEDYKLLYLYETGAKVRNRPGKNPRFYFTYGSAVRPWRWHFAARLEVETVVVTEGESDAIACIHAGVEDLFPKDGSPGRAVVACPGVSFPERWGKLFHQKHVVLFFDFDEPGIKGARRVASIIRKYAASVRIVTAGKENA
jgi:DNA primase